MKTIRIFAIAALVWVPQRGWAQSSDTPPANPTEESGVTTPSAGVASEPAPAREDTEALAEPTLEDTTPDGDSTSGVEPTITTEVEATSDGPVSETGAIEDISLECLLRYDCVTAVTRAPESIDTVPAIVTVLTREQIQRRGYRSLAEALQHVYGFYVIDDHILPNVAVRGISGGLRAESGLIQVTIDGVPVSYRPTGGHWLGPELIPMSVVERIEIVRGPASTVYGADAFLGVINIVTRTADRVEGLDARLSGLYSGDFGGDVDFTYGHREGDLDILLSWRLSREDRTGLRMPPSSPRPRIPSYNAGDELRAHGLEMSSAVGFGRLTWNIDTHTRVELTTYASVVDRVAEFAEWSQLTVGLDDSNRQRGNRVSLWQGYVDLSVRARPVEQLDIDAHIRGFAGSPLGTDRIDLGSSLYDVRRDNDFGGGALEARGLWTPVRELRLTAGLDGFADDEQLLSVRQVLLASDATLPAGSVRDATSTRQDRRTFLNGGLYLLGAYDIEERVQIHAGVRYDQHNIYGTQVNGRLGTTVGIVEGLTGKVFYGSAFRAPTPLLLYGVPLGPGDIVGNPNLAPQQIHSVEGQIRWSGLEWLSLQTSLAYSYLTNKAEFVREGTNLIARNLSELESWSWDVVGELNWNGLNGYASFSWVQGKRGLAIEGYRSRLWGSDIEAYPPITVHLGANYDIPATALRIGTELSYFDKRRASGNNILDAAGRYDIPAAWYWDATIALANMPLLGEGRQTTISLVVRNLLGTETAHPGFAGFDYPSAPRTFWLTWAQTL